MSFERNEVSSVGYELFLFCDTIQNLDLDLALSTRHASSLPGCQGF